jgi:hypothetical protein
VAVRARASSRAAGPAVFSEPHAAEEASHSLCVNFKTSGPQQDVRRCRQRPGAAYQGSITEASQVIRVLPAGSLRSPGLHEVADALGLEKSGAGPAPSQVCSPA